MSSEMMEVLHQAMEKGSRILISGGTRTGKTTLLSALCNFLPAIWRIVKIEDPEEIWVDRPTVQTVEARPQAIGTGSKRLLLRVLISYSSGSPALRVRHGGYNVRGAQVDPNINTPITYLREL